MWLLARRRIPNNTGRWTIQVEKGNWREVTRRQVAESGRDRADAQLELVYVNIRSATRFERWKSSLDFLALSQQHSNLSPPVSFSGFIPETSRLSMIKRALLSTRIHIHARSVASSLRQARHKKRFVASSEDPIAESHELTRLVTASSFRYLKRSTWSMKPLYSSWSKLEERRCVSCNLHELEVTALPLPLQLLLLLLLQPPILFARVNKTNQPAFCLSGCFSNFWQILTTDKFNLDWRGILLTQTVLRACLKG